MNNSLFPTNQLSPQNLITIKADWELDRAHVESKIIPNLTLVNILLNFKHQILAEISSRVMLLLRCKSQVLSIGKHLGFLVYNVKRDSLYI